MARRHELRVISTHSGVEIKVCDCHYSLVAGRTWRITTENYAQAVWQEGGVKHHAYMHRVIMGEPLSRVDHRDTDPTNNQCYNLRLSTNAENGRNRGPQKNNTSGYKGVSWSKKNKKWTGHICVNGRRKNLGYFHTKEEAARAYNVVAHEYFGEFAWLNPVD